MNSYIIIIIIIHYFQLAICGLSFTALIALESHSQSIRLHKHHKAKRITDGLCFPRIVNEKG